MQKPIFMRNEAVTGVYLWLILAGALLGALAVAKSIVDLRAYRASLDPIGLADEKPAGFLPAYTYSEQSSSLPLQAPTLDAAQPAEPGEPTAGELLAEPGSGNNSLPQIADGAPADANGGAAESALVDETSPKVPEYLSIPAIDVQTNIIPAESRVIESQGVNFLQWLAPDQFQTVGWHPVSAELGRQGNTVLNGHNNIRGEVFRNLDQLSKGDLIFVKSGSETFTYQVKLTTILKERHQPIEVKVENARWILPSSDERLTLISCWPYESNSHRVVVVAVPYRSGRGQPGE